MVETVVRVAEGETLEPVGQTKRFPQCQWPTQSEFARLDAAFEIGLADHVYRTWASWYGVDVLVSHDSRTPPAVTAAPVR